MHRPRIGITTGYRQGSQVVDHAYVAAVEAAGGLPVLVPMLREEESARAFAGLLNGLIITGGPAITRGLIGQLPPDLPATDPVRSQADDLIFTAVSAAAQPIFGICYGMQYLNAQAGGSIYADVMAQVPNTPPHSSDRGSSGHLTHFAADSGLVRALGQTSLHTNSHHIQAVAEVGTGLRAVGHSADGLIEAIESADGLWMGVQFHPEKMLEQTLPLFRAFVGRCRSLVG
jgi:putative glutamine amidotransferase